MYDRAVTQVIVGAIVVASAAVDLHVLARMLARPLAEVGAAPDGSPRATTTPVSRARVQRSLASLADSFNQMATALARQEAIRRDFIANAAHELRTLTNLQGYLEALRDGVIAGDAATYESLREEVDRLVRLSRSLDALAEGDAGGGPVEPTEIDLAAHIRTALALAMPTLERAGLELDVDVPDHLPARANPDYLTQVLANLLSNAARYTPRGGRVTVRGGRRSDVLVSVLNTGEAIPAADLPRVFERFYRVEKSRDRSAAAPASGLRSSSSWSRAPAAGSARSRRTGRPASGSRCLA